MKSDYEVLREIGEVPRYSLNNTFKDGLTEHYIVCPNKCILKSFKFLANNRDIHFTWTHCISMITFYITLLPGI